MPCSYNESLITNKSVHNTSSSACVDNIISQNVEFKNSSALMLGSSKTDSNIIIGNGYLNSPYIILSSRCDFNFGDAKLIGKVFLVNPDDFNQIYWTWTNKGMVDYIQKHNLVGIDYRNEKIDSHIDELIDATGNSRNKDHFSDHHFNEAFFTTVSSIAEKTDYYKDKYSEYQSKYMDAMSKYEEALRQFNEYKQTHPAAGEAAAGGSEVPAGGYHANISLSAVNDDNNVAGYSVTSEDASYSRDYYFA